MRIGRLAMSGILLVVGLLFLVMSLGRTRLECGAGVDAWCVVTGGPLGSQERARFPRSVLGEVRVDTRWGGKGNKTEYGRLVLLVGGRAIPLQEVDAEQARDVAESIQRARLEGSPIRAALRESYGVLVFGVIFVAAAIGLAKSAFSGIGRVWIDVDPRQRAIRVQRRIWGVPGKTEVHELGDVRDVAIENSEEKDFWRSRGETARNVARLVLIVGSNHEWRPLTSRSFAGKVVHQRAATALRKGLGLEPGPIEAELATIAHVRERPTWAKSLGVFGLAFIGLPVGGLLGIAIYGTVGLSIGALRMSDDVSGTAITLGGGLGALGGALLMQWLGRPRPLA